MNTFERKSKHKINRNGKSDFLSVTGYPEVLHLYRELFCF